jgi:hypothetical protein
MENEDETAVRARVPVSLARDAMRVAAKRDETLSQVIRRALRACVASAPAQTDLEDAIAAGRATPRGRRAKL